MECVRAGLGREVAHQLIKKHSTSTTAGNFFEVLASEKEFPLSLDQLKDLINEPSDFAGMAVEQSRSVAKKIKSVTDSKISKVELTQLR
jgi:adenylosuccinate lyase